MRYFALRIALLIGACSMFMWSTPSVVTYLLNGGRFGDNIHSLVQAYWISYAYNIEFHYMPFKHVDQLNLATEYAPYDCMLFTEGYRIEHIVAKRMQTYMQEGYLYIVHFNTDIAIDWHDHGFKNSLKKIIAPIKPITLPDFLFTSVALHVRMGGSFEGDSFAEKKRNPARFPGLDYYKVALRYMLCEHPEIEDIVICTDDEDPHSVAEKIVAELPHNRYNVHCSSDYWGEQNPVIHDFVWLQHARYLIRPQSHFSYYAQLLGEHLCTIKPCKVFAGDPYGRVKTMWYTVNNREKEVIC